GGGEEDRTPVVRLHDADGSRCAVMRLWTRPAEAEESISAVISDGVDEAILTVPAAWLPASMVPGLPYRSMATHETRSNGVAAGPYSPGRTGASAGASLSASIWISTRNWPSASMRR